jgi:REP-associated tyrosine transposase
MARRQRLHAPFSTYHVMLRGNDGQSIFFSEGDKSRLCLLMQQGMERFGHSIEAFCFMSNHIHLAVRVRIADISISRIMQHLAFRYTRYINRKHKRIGHLFQGRFKSILVDDEDYLKELIRYIHLNPVRAKLVFDPLEYCWSSHRAYLKLDEFSWLTKERVLKKFDLEATNAIKNYDKYILRGIGVETEYDFKSGCTAGMIGDQAFIEEIMVTRCAIKHKKIELTDLIAKVCEMHKISYEHLCMPGKHAKNSLARAQLAFFVRETDHISFTSLANVLERDPSTLTQLASRFEIKVSSNPMIAKNVEDMRCWLQKFVTMNS